MRTVATVAACVLAGASIYFAAIGKIYAQTATASPLQLEARIPLGDLRGRIDHMAVDLRRQRLFVAELGNDSIGIVDLTNRRVIHRIGGLSEPQGVGYVLSTETLYVANARDGSVRVFSGADYAPNGQIDLGENADNIRVDTAANEVVVGYGSGALALIDGKTSRRIGDIPLPAHPEGFQLHPASKQIFVNLPAARQIAVVDRSSRKQIGDWPIDIAGQNFPMAIDYAAGTVLTVFRDRAILGAFSIKDGALITSHETCGNAHDVFVDAKRNRVYVSCGDGYLDVLAIDANSYKRIARIPTIFGARTSLFVPELDRLLLAVSSISGESASVWVFRPAP